MGLLISLAHYGGCDLKSAGQAHSLYSRCLGYALPMVLSTNFPCSQWALIPNEEVKQCLRTSDPADILSRDKRYENVTINCIDGNGMRGIPLGFPYLYTIKRNRCVSDSFCL